MKIRTCCLALPVCVACASAGPGGSAAADETSAQAPQTSIAVTLPNAPGVSSLLPGDVWSTVTFRRVEGVVAITFGSLIGVTGTLTLAVNLPCASNDTRCGPATQEFGGILGGTFALGGAASIVYGVLELGSATRMAGRLRAAGVGLTPWTNEYGRGLALIGRF